MDLLERVHQLVKFSYICMYFCAYTMHMCCTPSGIVSIATSAVIILVNMQEKAVYQWVGQTQAHCNSEAQFLPYVWSTASLQQST